MPTQTAEYVEAIEHLPAGSTDVSWTDYERLLEGLGEGYAPRVWYDEGTLEVVTRPARTNEPRSSSSHLRA